MMDTANSAVDIQGVIEPKDRDLNRCLLSSNVSPAHVPCFIEQARVKYYYTHHVTESRSETKSRTHRSPHMMFSS